MRKESFDFYTKTLYRQAIYDFILKHYPNPLSRQTLKVACLSGPQALEVTKVYLALGIPAHRIYCLEENPSDAQKIRQLGLGVHVYEGTARSFFEKKAKGTFDIINLDFQTMMGEEEAATIRAIFQCGHAPSNLILGTNFFGAREQKKRQNQYSSVVRHYTTGGAVNDLLPFAGDDLRERLQHEYFNDASKNQPVDLVSTRDQFISLGLRFLTSVNTIEEMARVIRPNTFKRFLENAPLNQKHVTLDTILANPAEYTRQIQVADAVERMRLYEAFAYDFIGVEEQRNLLVNYVENTRFVRPYYITDFHKGKYVSDTGSSMWFDILVLENRKDLFKNVWVDIGVATDGRSQVIIQDRTGIKGAREAPIEVLGNPGKLNMECSRFASEYEFALHKINSGGVVFQGRKRVFDKKTREFANVNNRETAYVKAERILLEDRVQVVEPTQVKPSNDLIRSDIKQQLPDKTIMEKYTISTMQLAGHKAYLRRKGEWEPTVTPRIPRKVEKEILKILHLQAATESEVLIEYNITQQTLDNLRSREQARLAKKHAKNKMQTVIPQTTTPAYIPAQTQVTISQPHSRAVEEKKMINAITHQQNGLHFDTNTRKRIEIFVDDILYRNDLSLIPKEIGLLNQALNEMNLPRIIEARNVSTHHVYAFFDDVTHLIKAKKQQQGFDLTSKTLESMLDKILEAF